MRLEINQFSSEEKRDVCLCYLQTAKCTVFAQPSLQETEPLTACASAPQVTVPLSKILVCELVKGIKMSRDGNVTGTRG